MADNTLNRWATRLIVILILVSTSISAHQNRNQASSSTSNEMKKEVEANFILEKVFNLSPSRLGYQHTWPEMKFGWRIVVGTIVGFLGAAFGTVGGVGGGGIFVPMLKLIIGFDAKSATAISKCMITGGAGATVFYNLKQRHPTKELPMIDYDLALLFQPMLVLGISLGVILNVILAEWMIAVLLIIIFLVISTKAFFKGVETWKKETILKKETAARQALLLNESTERNEEGGYEALPSSGSSNEDPRETTESKKETVPIMKNVRWKELALLFAVWAIILAIQIGKNYTVTCSAAYWVLNVLQIPVAVSVTSYQAVLLYKGKRAIESNEGPQPEWTAHQLIFCCALGLAAGIVGGLLGLGGGFILGPLFIDLGINPQVSSATSTFAMTFSASMSVVEYYLLKRFPIPYTLYFVGIAIVAAVLGQYLVKKLIVVLGRASLIIFILAFTIFVSAISLGGVDIADIIEEIEKHEYMGFDSLCTSSS
ncbi:sulfite exporter TauE/SafE family protein 3-like isoform X1 [Prosopis cineraria]|uniref:sulfite exporter TauE/SafE family protein 3-like isoform X1 n=2 Tax=Prosopis cineraria TaxID=364024 RepID=UPI0024108DAB|nr:sulfite exporter TauE/SafE family protein 3-like isoform X1 [Prosopis cineraria]